MIGVLFMYLALNGVSHFFLPSATPMPASAASVGVTTCLTPATVSRIGEPYGAPPPFHSHFTSPLARSYAVSPPTYTMHLPSTMSGDDDVKNLGKALVSLRHRNLPLFASQQETTPRTPSVHTLPS